MQHKFPENVGDAASHDLESSDISGYRLKCATKLPKYCAPLAGKEPWISKLLRLYFKKILNLPVTTK